MQSDLNVDPLFLTLLRDLHNYALQYLAVVVVFKDGSALNSS